MRYRFTYRQPYDAIDRRNRIVEIEGETQADAMYVFRQRCPNADLLSVAAME